MPEQRLSSPISSSNGSIASSSGGLPALERQRWGPSGRASSTPAGTFGRRHVDSDISTTTPRSSQASRSSTARMHGPRFHCRAGPSCPIWICRTPPAPVPSARTGIRIPDLQALIAVRQGVRSVSLSANACVAFQLVPAATSIPPCVVSLLRIARGRLSSALRPARGRLSGWSLIAACWFPVFLTVCFRVTESRPTSPWRM